MHSPVHDDCDSIIKYAFSEYQNVQSGVNLHLLKDCKHCYRVST